MFRIGAHTIGSGRVFVVAEVGSNHRGSLSLALEHIEAAAEAGADAVKFQSICYDHLYLKPDPKGYPFLELPEEWYPELKARCKACGVMFFSAPTYMEAVDALENVGVELYKLASPQVAAFPQLVRRVARLGKPVFVSLGQVNLEEVARVVKIFREERNPHFVLLHCTSLYPTPYERANLQRMVVLREVFGVPVGFSDHTIGIYLALAAAALGASVVEKHFRLDRPGDYPEAAVSLTPREFQEMVKGIRAVETGLRETVHLEPEPEEIELRRRLIYRLVLNRPKRKGEAFQQGDFRYLRHSCGIEAEYEEFLIKHFSCRRNMDKGEVLEWRDVEGR